MLPGYLDDVALGFVLVRRGSSTPEIVDANRTAARLLGLDRSDLIGKQLGTIDGLETVGSRWTGSSADGDSPVVVRARVGPAAAEDVTPTPGEDALLGFQAARPVARAGQESTE